MTAFKPALAVKLTNGVTGQAKRLVIPGQPDLDSVPQVGINLDFIAAPSQVYSMTTSSFLFSLANEQAPIDCHW